MKYLETTGADCVLYAPESFEYLVLCAGVVDVPKAVLQETYQYCDSQQFMSWEEFFTRFLADATRNTVF